MSRFLLGSPCGDADDISVRGDQEGMRRCAGYSRSLGRTGIRSEDLGQARYTAAGWWDASSGVTLSGSGGSACVRVMIAQLGVIAITR